MPVMNNLQLPFNGDAHNFLKLLSFTLDRNGGLVNINSNTLSIMESCKLMVDRCMIMHAMRATKEEDLKLLLSAGAWDELFFWLREARSSANVCLLMELLQLYKMLPINTHLLRQNSCAKEIKQLIKFPDDRVSRLAKVVVSDWMQKVAGVPIGAIKSSAKSLNKSAPKPQTAIENPDTKLTKQTNHLSSSNLSPNSDSQRQESHIDSQSTVSSKRPQTVKSLGLRMRSTGLEDPVAAVSNAVISSKKTSVSDKNEFAPSTLNGIAQKHPPAKTTKTKTIPANSLFSDFTSHGFLNALSSTEPSNILKRKRKPSQISPTTNGPNLSKEVVSKINNADAEADRNGDEGFLEPSDQVKTNEMSSEDQSQETNIPFTLSFYRELEKEDRTEDVAKFSPIAELSDEVTPEQSSAYQPPLEQPAKKKVKIKRSVTWADDFNLCTYFYFQINKEERVNVSKYGGFEEGRKHEQEMERKLFQRHPNAALTLPSTILLMPWRNPPLLDGVQHLIVPGNGSKEKRVQMEREAGVLQVIYFQRECIPDSPSEPDIDYMLMDEENECKNIPLYDVTDPSACPPLPPLPMDAGNFGLPSALSSLFAVNQQQPDAYNNQNAFMYGNQPPPMFQPQFGAVQQQQQQGFPMQNFAPPINSWAPPPPPPPLRPAHYQSERPICRHFSNTGRCRFGNNCKFTHPIMN